MLSFRSRCRQLTATGTQWAATSGLQLSTLAMRPSGAAAQTRNFSSSSCCLSSSVGPSPLTTTPPPAATAAAAVTGAAPPHAQHSAAQWAAIGEAIIAEALRLDAGPDAFAECLEARQQLETILRSAGYEMDVYMFGGLAVLGLLEVDGDIDFVAVAQVEPQFDEAGDIVARIAREMRRLGLKAEGIPRARVPVVKVDRTSRVMPGTPLHSVSRWAIFQCARAMSEEERGTFATRLKELYNAQEVQWNNTFEFASVRFPSSMDLITAITQVSSHGSAPIPLRLPLDLRKGPELYRFQFDLVLNTMGLRNTHLIAEYLSMYPFARHLLLILKRWGRASGVVDTVDGMLASYAITVMLVHFLVRKGVIPAVDVHRIAAEPNLLPQEPQYRPLRADGTREELAVLGQLLGEFFEYFGSQFDFDKQVVCTTQLELEKATLNWTTTANASKPPFFHFAIKDPYSAENIARNLDAQSARYVKEAHRLSLELVRRDIADAPFLVNNIITKPPKPYFGNRELVPGISNKDSEEYKARYLLKKVEFHRRKDSLQRYGQVQQRRREDTKVAADVTRSVVEWIKKGTNTSKPR